MKSYGKLWFCWLLFVLCACSAVGNAPNSGATMQAEQTQFVDESTRIASTLRVRGTEVMATAAFAETYVMNADGINRQLAATMRALIPPTDQVIDTSGLVTPGLIARPGELAAATSAPNAPEAAGTVSADSPNVFTEVATAAGVRDSDGCATAPQSEFSSSATEIFVTARVLNATAGTTVSASWAYEGEEVVVSPSFTIEQDDPDFCVWFFIEPVDVTFSAGSWSVQFVVNGAPQQPPASFVIS
jgi:hypothetical protein